MTIGSPEMYLEIAMAQLQMGASDRAGGALAQAAAASDRIGSKRLRWRQHLIAVRVQLAMGDKQAAAEERAAYLEECKSIVGQVPGPDRASFEALIAAEDDAALRSHR